MGAYDPQQVKAFIVLCAIGPPFVFVVTMFRLWVKGKKRWWWDDAFVSLGIATMIAQQCMLWGSRSVLPNQTVHVAIFYPVIICTFLQVLCARLAILVSVTRIAPNSRTRTITQWIGALFVVLFLLLVAQLIWVCVSHTEFIPALHMPICNFTKQVPILQLTVSMIADSFLIATPLSVLRHLTSDSVLRQRLVFIFVASICTTIASLVQSVLNILQLPFAVLVAAEMEAWVSLLVCNLGVIVTAISKACSSKSSTTASSINIPQMEQESVPTISVLQFASPPGSGGIEPGLREGTHVNSETDNSHIIFVTMGSQSDKSRGNDLEQQGPMGSADTQKTSSVLDIS